MSKKQDLSDKIVKALESKYPHFSLGHDWESPVLNRSDLILILSLLNK